MRKNNLIIIIILFIPFNLLHSQFKLNYGFKAGAVSAHINEIYEGGEYAYSSKWGFGAGIFLEGSFNNNISISGELDYLQGGWYDDDLSQKYSMNVLSVPVLLKLKTDAGKFTPYLLAGPKFDFLLSMDSVNHSFDKAIFPIYGVTLGAGCERVVWKNYSILAEIRYNYDFESMFKVFSMVDVSYNYSRSLEFLIGVKF
jgi:hypothetical protein